MKTIKIEAPTAWNDVRGPTLVRWLTDADLRFPGVENYYAEATGEIAGALTDDNWVVFKGIQAILIVADEVHSGDHLDYKGEELGSAWRIDDSSWIRTFSPRHLDGCSHFIIRFYDEVVELICKELIFGKAPFDLKIAIEANPQISFPYFQLATSHEKAGDIQGAIRNFEKYLSLQPSDMDSSDYVEKKLVQLRK